MDVEGRNTNATGVTISTYSCYSLYLGYSFYEPWWMWREGGGCEGRGVDVKGGRVDVEGGWMYLGYSFY